MTDWILRKIIKKQNNLKKVIDNYHDYCKFDAFWWAFYDVLVAWEDGLVVSKREVGLDRNKEEVK